MMALSANVAPKVHLQDAFVRARTITTRVLSGVRVQRLTIRTQFSASQRNCMSPK